MKKPIRWKQLVQLISAHFKEIIREPEVLFWGIAFPMLMSLGLGIAFTKKVDIVRQVALVEPASGISASPPGGEIERFLQRSAEKIKSRDAQEDRYQVTMKDAQLGTAVFIFRKTDWQEAMRLMKRGTLALAITEADDRVRYHFDPSNTDAQLTYLRLSKMIGGRPSNRSETTADVEPLTVPGTRYIDFLVPGLIAMGIMMSCMWGLSYGMIEKRSQKLLRRMVATPMRKSHLLIALMIVRTGMNLIEAGLLFVFAWLVFGITIQGNPAALLALFVAGNIAFAGIAVFVSARTEKTETGNGLVNVVVMPMMVLSGIFFSYHNFPQWSLPFIRKLPLTLLADGLRSIFIEGAGFPQISVPLFVLTATGVFFFLIGLRRFKWH